MHAGRGTRQRTIVSRTHTTFRILSGCSECNQQLDADRTPIPRGTSCCKQIVISAGKPVVQADVSDLGTSRPSRLNSIHQIIAWNFLFVFQRKRENNIFQVIITIIQPMSPDYVHDHHHRLSSFGLTVLYTAWCKLVPETFRSSAVLLADQSLHTTHSSSPVQA